VEASTLAVRRLSRAIAELATAATRGMSRAFDINRVGLLRLAVERGPITPGEAAAELDLPASSVTRHAQALAEAGQVAIGRNPGDARSALISATDRGRAELEALDGAGAQVFGGVVEGWSEEDVEALARLAERLAADWAARGAQARRRRRIVSRWQRTEKEEQA
jgi:DNA-binding MarR family transcriptional regulator